MRKIVFLLFPVLLGCSEIKQESDVTDTEKIKEEVWHTVQTINRHWAITENIDSLAMFFHKDMYILIFEKGQWLAVAQHYSFY